MSKPQKTGILESEEFLKFFIDFCNNNKIDPDMVFLFKEDEVNEDDSIPVEIDENFIEEFEKQYPDFSFENSFVKMIEQIAKDYMESENS